MKYIQFPDTLEVIDHHGFSECRELLNLDFPDSLKSIGNYAFYEEEPIILGKSACYFSLLNGVCKEYICIFLKSKVFFDYARQEATQTTIKNVSLKSMRMLPVPLPPLAEQKRIVAKIEELLPLCERLK